MWWILGTLAVLAATAFFMVGLVYEDEALALTRCWYRVRYATTILEAVRGMTTGVLLVVILYILNGMLRLLTLLVGILTILTGSLAQQIGEMPPPSPRGSKRFMEVGE